MSSVSKDTSTIILFLGLREHWGNGENVRGYTYQVSPDLNKDDTSRLANTDGVRGSTREFNTKQRTEGKEGMLAGWGDIPKHKHTIGYLIPNGHRHTQVILYRLSRLYVFI